MENLDVLTDNNYIFENRFWSNYLNVVDLSNSVVKKLKDRVIHQHKKLDN